MSAGCASSVGRTSLGRCRWWSSRSWGAAVSRSCSRCNRIHRRGPRRTLGDLTRSGPCVWPSGPLTLSPSALCLLTRLSQALGSAVFPAVCGIPCVRFTCVARLTCRLHSCNTRDAWLVRPYSAGTCTLQEAPSFAWHTNRDREGPHGLPPPTPPYVRVTYTAVRRVESMRRSKAEESERVEERCWKRDTQRRALTETPGSVCRFGGVPGKLSAYAAAA
jgi:hypothetical protein